MNKFILTLMSIFILVESTSSQNLQPVVVKPYGIAVSERQTTHIVFPSAIWMIDRGDEAVLAQRAPGQENILQLKGSMPSFESTNVTVVTKDGKLYSFLAHYEKIPQNLTFEFNQSAPVARNSNHIPALPNDLVYESESELVLKAKPKLRAHSSRNGNVIFRITGWFVSENRMYCRLEIDNKSAIDYPIESLKFSISDRLKMKRSTSQVIAVDPAFAKGNQTIIKANTKENLVFAFDAFTLPRQKYLRIQLFERNGGRYLQLRLDDRVINRAKSLYN